jgi:hypothetical protein
MTGMTLLGVVAALAAAQSSTAAITVGTNAAAPALRVDATGNAEVSWMSGGNRTTLVVPVSGRPQPGGALAADDVSRAVRGTHIPFQSVLRTGPGGWYYALQEWRVEPGGPVALRFSRWRGVPTEVSLTAAASALHVRLTGRTTLDEKPVPSVQRGHVFLDSLIGGTWKRVGRVALTKAGSYRRLVTKPDLGHAYRATYPGPNIGATYAPDASSVVDAPGELDPGR